MRVATAVNPTWHPLADGIPPEWAVGWGEDRAGPFVDVAVADVTQRLRWIPPGRFVMGSPEGEPGRWDDEGPQHPVTISRGFWLMDTPCTQALWQAVMGGNPSRFKSPDRPVEKVRWTDVQEFLAAINRQVPGLDFELPTEAQWEYACRAGTTTALYTGDIKILGENNAPVLDRIAWYGGNSSAGFELNNGPDTGDWPEKQYPGGPAGTHPVGRKRPNPWGLYDMLGNVWEWCCDDRRDYGVAAEADPGAPLNAGAKRVVRGGSWYYDARYVRAAVRLRLHPDGRYDLGFRCSRVQA